MQTWKRKAQTLKHESQNILKTSKKTKFWNIFKTLNKHYTLVKTFFLFFFKQKLIELMA